MKKILSLTGAAHALCWGAKQLSGGAEGHGFGGENGGAGDKGDENGGAGDEGGETLTEEGGSECDRKVSTPAEAKFKGSGLRHHKDQEPSKQTIPMHLTSNRQRSPSPPQDSSTDARAEEFAVRQQSDGSDSVADEAHVRSNRNDSLMNENSDRDGRRRRRSASSNEIIVVSSPTKRQVTEESEHARDSLRRLDRSRLLEQSSQPGVDSRRRTSIAEMPPDVDSNSIHASFESWSQVRFVLRSSGRRVLTATTQPCVDEHGMLVCFTTMCASGISHDICMRASAACYSYLT